MTQNHFETAQSHLVPGNHIGDALWTMLCTEHVSFRSIFLDSAFFQIRKTRGQVNRSSGSGETAFVIMGLACVFVYSKRNGSICTYTTSSETSELSFLLQVVGGWKGEAKLNADIQIQNARIFFYYFFFQVALDTFTYKMPLSSILNSITTDFYFWYHINMIKAKIILKILWELKISY